MQPSNRNFFDPDHYVQLNQMKMTPEQNQYLFEKPELAGHSNIFLNNIYPNPIGVKPYAQGLNNNFPMMKQEYYETSMPDRKENDDVKDLGRYSQGKNKTSDSSESLFEIQDRMNKQGNNKNTYINKIQSLISNNNNSSNSINSQSNSNIGGGTNNFDPNKYKNYKYEHVTFKYIAINFILYFIQKSLCQS
jgi:hypothetical protein